MKTAFKTLRVMTALLAAMTVFAAQAMAATVTNSGDTGAGSLRQAITDATGGDTIIFNNDYTIILTSGELSIAKNLTIDGTGHTIIVKGNNASRVFNITAGTVLIRNLTVTEGRPGINVYGGGIYNTATLSLENCSVDGNQTTGYSGGGIHNRGTLSLTGCTVSNNTSPGNGGGIENYSGSLTVVNSTVSGNTSGSLGGGIIHTGTSLTITGSTISGNSALQGGGGINVWEDFTLVNSTVSGNSADEGGGIYCLNSIVKTMDFSPRLSVYCFL